MYNPVLSTVRCLARSSRQIFTLKFTDLFLQLKKLNAGRCVNVYLTACENREDSRQTTFPRGIFGILATKINNL